MQLSNVINRRGHYESSHHSTWNYSALDQLEWPSRTSHDWKSLWRLVPRVGKYQTRPWERQQKRSSTHHWMFCTGSRDLVYSVVGANLSHVQRECAPTLKQSGTALERETWVQFGALGFLAITTCRVKKSLASDWWAEEGFLGGRGCHGESERVIQPAVYLLVVSFHDCNRTGTYPPKWAVCIGLAEYTIYTEYLYAQTMNLPGCSKCGLKKK